MRTETWTLRIFAFTISAFTAGLLVSVGATSAFADDNASNQSESCATCSSCQGHVHEGPACELSGNRFVDFWRIRKMKMGAWMTRKHLDAHSGCQDDSCRSGRCGSGRGHRSLQQKFGYFNPTGCCGGGCPLLGKYNMVYAANPGYFDSRDGRLYAAQGSGVPMAVPLAPNVRYGYNYGWGIPSSRLTRISRVATETPVRRTGR